MTKTILSLALAFIYTTGHTQLTTTPSGGNKKASVSERIGLTDVTIHYDRPGVKGRNGKIWGGLVYTGFSNLGFGTAKASPWRAGANENTTFTFSDDVTINGQPLPAGKYGFFIAYDPQESTLIFSKNSDAWGSYFYHEEDDALRVKTKPVPITVPVEWLKYEFAGETDTTALVVLSWENMSIPFTVGADLSKVQIETFRKELTGGKGFSWTAWNQAAQWCLAHHVNLEEAIQWADSATSRTFGGDQEFQALSTKAQLLDALNRHDEARNVMKAAMPSGKMMELHQYGRMLLSLHQPNEALDIFKYNYQKNPKEFTTLVGMARGYSAKGDYKKALKYALQAQPISPDELNRKNLEMLISKLREGKDMN